MDERGVVHCLSVNVTQRLDGRDVHSRLEYRVAQLGGVRVEKPDWVSDAIEQTEDEADEPQRTNRVQIVSGFGNVTENERVDYVNFTVMRAAGSSDIDLSATTVEWNGPETTTTLTHGERATADQFAVTKIKDPDDSVPVLDERDDRFVVSLNAAEIGGALEAGEVVEVRITAESGAVTIYRANVHDSFEGESAVTV